MADPRAMAAKGMLQSSGAGAMDVNQQGMNDEFKGMLGVIAGVVKQAIAGDQKAQQIIIELGKALPQIAQGIMGGGEEPAPEGEAPMPEEGGLG